MIIKDQLGMMIMDSSGYPKVYVAYSEDVDDREVPFGLFIECYADEVEITKLGAYENITQAQHALNSVYVAMQSGVSISLEDGTNER